MNPFELDPAHCLLTPGNSLDLMLRIKTINVKLDAYIDNHQFIETMIRTWGCLTIFKSYDKANNKFFKLCNPSKQSTHIKCLDPDNLGFPNV